MLKTNSKTVNEKLKNIILSTYENDLEYYTWDGKEAKKDYAGICSDILTAFFEEKVKYDNRYKAGRISKQDLFLDWMQGLPSAFSFACDIFLSSSNDIVAGLLEQTETEKSKYDEEASEKLIVWLLYRELTKHAK